MYSSPLVRLKLSNSTGKYPEVPNPTNPCPPEICSLVETLSLIAMETKPSYTMVNYVDRPYIINIKYTHNKSLWLL